MDDQRFDRLTRAFGYRLSRRHVALLASGVVGLRDSQSSQGQTLGKRRCGRRRCKKHRVCFKKKCRVIPVAGKRCFSNGFPCRNGAICVATGVVGNEVCVCPAGTTVCGTFPDISCVNLRTDAFHCGSCRNRCLVGYTTCCAAGPLEPGACVDPNTDPQHCGGCGRSCGAGTECIRGQCQIPGCVPYGGACSSASDCCLLNDGSHVPCSGGLCRFN